MEEQKDIYEQYGEYKCNYMRLFMEEASDAMYSDCTFNIPQCEDICNWMQSDMETRRDMALAFGGYTCDHMKGFEEEVTHAVYSDCTFEIPECNPPTEYVYEYPAAVTPGRPNTAMTGFNPFQLLIILLLAFLFRH